MTKRRIYHREKENALIECFPQSGKCIEIKRFLNINYHELLKNCHCEALVLGRDDLYIISDLSILQRPIKQKIASSLRSSQ